MSTLRRSKNYTITTFALIISIILGSAIASAARISSPEDAYKLAHPEIGGLAHEEAVAFFVDSQGEVLKQSRITQHREGGIYYVPWELLIGSLLPEKTSFLYLVHNHPSGNPSLSSPDIELGSFWAHKASLNGVQLDLLAITKTNGYTSLLESGQLLSPDQLDKSNAGYLSYVVQPGLKILGSGFVKAFAD